MRSCLKSFKSVHFITLFSFLFQNFFPLYGWAICNDSDKIEFTLGEIDDPSLDKNHSEYNSELFIKRRQQIQLRQRIVHAKENDLIRADNDLPDGQKKTIEEIFSDNINNKPYELPENFQFGCTPSHENEKKVVENLIKKFPKGNFQDELNFNLACDIDPTVQEAIDKKKADLKIFREYAADLLKDDNYQYIDNDSIDREMQKVTDIINNSEDEKKLIRGELARSNATEVAKKVIKHTANVVIFEGIPGLITKGGIEGFIKAQRNIKKRFQERKNADGNEDNNYIKLDKLLPPDSTKISRINAGVGSSLVLLGITGIVADTLTFGVGGLPFNSAGAGIKIGGAIGKSKLENKGRSKILDANLKKREENYKKEAVHETLDPGIDRVAEEIGVQIAKNIAENSIESGLNSVISILPFVGGAYHITNGFKLMSQAITGHEKGHEILMEYEKLYKNIVDASILTKQIELDLALRQAQKLMFNDLKQRKSLRDEEKIAISKTVNCLCKAVKWTEDHQKQIDKKFDNRFQYLEKIINRKNQRKKVWDDFKQAFGADYLSASVNQLDKIKSTLQEENEDLKKNYQDLIQTYMLTIKDNKNEKLKFQDYLKDWDSKFKEPSENILNNTGSIEKDKIISQKNLIQEVQLETQKKYFHEKRIFDFLKHLNEEIVVSQKIKKGRFKTEKIEKPLNDITPVEFQIHQNSKHTPHGRPGSSIPLIKQLKNQIKNSKPAQKSLKDIIKNKQDKLQKDQQ